MTAAHAIDYGAVRDLALAAATASKDLLRTPAGATPRSAKGRDIKLEEDRQSEALILDILLAGSAWPVLSEEAGWVGGRPDADNPYWVVDPLDGSFNYFRGVPLCCTSIALCSGLRPLAGAIYDFNRDELFWGGAGLGLEIDGRRQASRTASTGILATGFPVLADHSPEGMGRMVAGLQGWKKIRMIGSAALSVAWVAAGRFDAYAESGTRWWDVAAGLALVEGAGGGIAIADDDPEKPMAVRAWGPGAAEPMG